MTANPGYDELPERYALGLRLRRSGLDDAEIAGRLSIEPESVPALLRIAEAKLARIRATHEPPTPQAR